MHTKTSVANDRIDVFCPIDGNKTGEVPVLSTEQAIEASRRAKKAQAKWGAKSFDERGEIIREFVEILKKNRKEVADLLVLESGKTAFEAYIFEIASIIRLANYFRKNAQRILKPKKISISLFKNRSSYLHYRPRGVVLVIAPWNFPLSNSMGEVLMGLIAGNAVILKPASITPLTAVKMRRFFDQAGLDKDLFQVITGPGRLASELIENGTVNFVSFTGSTETGKRVAEICGRRLIPCTMELGGKAPALVLEDAKPDLAVQSIVWGAFANSGQICASVERVLVHESLHDHFLKRSVALTKSLRQGDPRQAEVDVGSITDPRQIDIIESLVKDAAEKGAKILTGGKRLSEGSNFFEPTIIADVTEDMAVMREESFGPLMPVMKFKDEEEAIRIANDTRYGLMASVFSSNGSHAKEVAERIEAGTVIINDTLLTHSFPEVPWQGIKDSGFGRVHSDDGLRDLCLSLHINKEVISMANPVWYPYSQKKVDRMMKLLDIFG
jgi:succinate-semialdehyde dehydrogenase/glutarate-semialdehyde dehydrogenase